MSTPINRLKSVVDSGMGKLHVAYDLGSNGEIVSDRATIATLVRLHEAAPALLEYISRLCEITEGIDACNAASAEYCHCQRCKLGTWCRENG